MKLFIVLVGILAVNASDKKRTKNGREQTQKDVQALKEIIGYSNAEDSVKTKMIGQRFSVIEPRNVPITKRKEPQVKTLTKRNFANEFFTSPNLLSIAMVFLDVKEYIRFYWLNDATKQTGKMYYMMLNQPMIKELRFEQTYYADSTNDQIQDLEVYANFLTKYEKNQRRCAIRQKIVLIFYGLFCLSFVLTCWLTPYIGFYLVILEEWFFSIVGFFRNFFSDSLKLNVRGVQSQFIKLQREYKCDSFLKQIKACIGDKELLKAPFHFHLKVPFPFESRSRAYVLDRVKLLPQNHVELVYKGANTFWSSLYEIRANYEVVFDNNHAQISLREVFPTGLFNRERGKHNDFDQIPGFQNNLEATISSCTYKKHFLNDLIQKLKTF